jgi:integrase
MVSSGPCPWRKRCPRVERLRSGRIIARRFNVIGGGPTTSSHAVASDIIQSRHFWWVDWGDKLPKIAKELGPLAVSRLTTPGLHAVGGVNGLALHVNANGARSWILRTLVGGKRREIGLGSYPTVTLAVAREKAREKRDAIERGADPVADRRAAQSALRAANAAARTFRQCSDAYIEAHELSWRNAKHGQQWRNTLEQYAHPIIGNLIVRDVEVSHVLRVLEPIWTEKTETASRLRGRIEKVLDWATSREYRQGLNPARWKGHLDHLLAERKRSARIVHHAAVPVDDMPAFMQALRAAEGTGALALEFLILTAARSGEVRGATWAEVDMKAKVWTIPANRMKAGKEHRVPLSPAALSVLKRAQALPRVDGSEFVFPAPRGGALSDMTLTAVMRRMNVPAVPHGFRSTFRDWTAERTDYPRDVAEMALAHAIGDKVEAAYRRGDLFDKRRLMMAEWAAFLSRERRPIRRRSNT